MCASTFRGYIITRVYSLYFLLRTYIILLENKNVRKNTLRKRFRYDFNVYKACYVNAKRFKPAEPVVTRLVLPSSHRDLNLNHPPQMSKGPRIGHKQVFDDMERSALTIIT